MSVFEVRSLKRRQSDGIPIKKGAILYAEEMPNGNIYLSNYGIAGLPGIGSLGRVFETEAVEGVDFERI